MPQSSSTKPAEKARVTFEYEADNTDELTIRVGEIVEIVNKNTDNDGWWEVRPLLHSKHTSVVIIPVLSWCSLSCRFD